MDTKPSEWDAMLAKLEAERDELKLKMHLGKKELQAEWERLEAQWHERKNVRGPALKDALSRIGTDLKKSYADLRKIL